MKILSIEHIREADKYTIENEPIASIDLMERAGNNCVKWIADKIKDENRLVVFAGPGNNGGDGLVVARKFAEKGQNVLVVIPRFTDKTSEDFQINYERIKKQGKAKIINFKDGDEFPELSETDIVIDAIFGSGLARPVKGFLGRLFSHINESKAIVIAIDIPSGLFADAPIHEKEGSIIHADYTLSLQFPKLSMLFPKNDRFVGDLYIIPIGLHPYFIEKVEVKNYLVEKDEIKRNLKKRGKYSHKGSYGHGLLISGSYGKMGAAVLASKAAIRTGIGLITTHIPQKGYKIIQIATPETMVSIDEDKYVFSKLPDLSNYNVIGIGPGLGLDEKTQCALKLLIQQVSSPMVFDADAINILAENKTWLSFLPKGSILTPHPKEFERISQKVSNSFERIEVQREMSVKHSVYIVLKGAHTSISCPDGSIYFNSTGNPGMATAGSGDVLTGIILSLLAQNYHPKLAAIIGVYLHGLAGDFAAEEYGLEALSANDIIENIGKAYLAIR